MSDFHLDAVATLKHINPRKEGPDDDKILALDIKFNCKAEGELALEILGEEDFAPIRRFLWKEEGDDVEPRFPMLGVLKSQRVITNMNVTLGGLYLPGADLKKFEMQPESDWAIDLTFTVTVSEPPTNTLPLLAENLHDYLKVIVEPAQQELGLEATQAEQQEGAA